MASAVSDGTVELFGGSSLGCAALASAGSCPCDLLCGAGSHGVVQEAGHGGAHARNTCLARRSLWKSHMTRYPEQCVVHEAVHGAMLQMVDRLMFEWSSMEQSTEQSVEQSTEGCIEQSMEGSMHLPADWPAGWPTAAAAQIGLESFDGGCRSCSTNA
eukprot:362705-Chlamydomonas_euryale.AAC.9